MSSRKTLDIDLLTLRKVYPVGPTNRPQPANTIFTVNSTGEGTWVNPIDNLVANGIFPRLPDQLSTMQTQIADLNGAVFNGIDPHAEFVTKTEFMSTLVSPLPSTVLASKGIIAGPDPSNNMLGIVSKSGLSVQNSGFNYWIATGGSEPLKEILTTTDFVTFTGQSGVDFNTAPSGITPQCYTIETNGSIWVAGGTSINNVTVKPILFSNDGITWIPVTWNGGTMQSACYTIKYNGSMWIAVGGAGISNPIYYSMDGITWSPSTGSTASSPFAIIKALDYANGEWYAIGDDKYLYTSINGTQWSKTNNTIPTITITTYALRVYYLANSSGQASLNPIFVIANAQALYKYNIGTNTVTSLIANFSCYAVDTNGLMWVAVGKGLPTNTNTLYYTTDITATIGWTAVSGVSFTTGTSVSWTGSEWLCTGNDASGNNYIYSSINGINWTLKKKFTNDEQGVEVINQILTLAPAVYVAPGQQRVGVFTTEPNAALDIQGDVIVRNNLTVQNQLILNTGLDVNTIYTNNIHAKTGGDINMNDVNLTNVNSILYPNTGGSYFTGINNNGKFAISYGTSDFLVLDGSGVSTNTPIAFNNPNDNILQGRIVTDGNNSGNLYAEVVNKFIVSTLRVTHKSAEFDVSGQTITLYDDTNILGELTTGNVTVNGLLGVNNLTINNELNAPTINSSNVNVSGSVDASNVNINNVLNAPTINSSNINVSQILTSDIVVVNNELNAQSINSYNVNVSGLLDVSNVNVSDIFIAENVTINNNLEVFNILSANTVSMKTCGINGGSGSENTTLSLVQADPSNYWNMYVASVTAGGLTKGNFSLWSYSPLFNRRAIDIDASCSSVTLCNGDVSGNVCVSGPRGPGRVYDDKYNLPPTSTSNITTVSYDTSGSHTYTIPVGSYSITIEYCGGGGGGGWTDPDTGGSITTYGGGGSSGVINKYTFSIKNTDTQNSKININIGAGGTGASGGNPAIRLGGDGDSTTINIEYTANNYGYNLSPAGGGYGGNDIDGGGGGGVGGFGGINFNNTPGGNGIGTDTSIIATTNPSHQGVGGWNIFTGDATYNGILYGGVGGNGCINGYTTFGGGVNANPIPAQAGQDGYAIITLTKLP
jgi:hypothetical protein